MDVVHYIVDYSTNFIATGGICFGFFLVFIECFIPILPLSVFIALNVNAFGLFTGILISWIATSLGSFLCYLFFSFIEKKMVTKILNKKLLMKVKRGIDTFQTISFSKLVLLITLPFTPAFLINIIGGLARIPKEKFLFALLIGKVFSTTFWGYIGKSLLASLTNIYAILFIAVTLIVAYAISWFVSRKFNIV
jgi:uncharacterized membrane protein YdjX (TVP38/TMEM64 family)